MTHSISLDLHDDNLAALRAMDQADAADRARHDRAQAPKLATQFCKTLDHGVVFFQDLKGQHHASKARPGDIILLDGFQDHADADDIAAEIADDINLQRGII